MLAGAFLAGRALRARLGYGVGGALGLIGAALVAALVSGQTFGTDRLHVLVPLIIAGGGFSAASRTMKKRAADGGRDGVDLWLICMTVMGLIGGLIVVGWMLVVGIIPAVPTGLAISPANTLFGRVGDYFWHISLPVLASTIAAFATLTLLTKNSFLDEIKKQYVMTARAKGLSEARVLYGHVFRNGMLIVISGFPALFIGVFFGGSLIIETLFSLDGLGRLGFEAALQRDYPVVFGTLFAFSLIGLIVGIITDLTYVLIDPRIDFEARN